MFVSLIGVLYSLRLFDTDSGKEVWSTTAAHHGVIYSLSWNADDSALLSTSGDGTAKIWNVVCLHFLVRRYLLRQQQQQQQHYGESNTNSSIDAGNSIAGLLLNTSSSDPTINQTESTSHRFQSKLYTARPHVMATYAHSPPTYVYCGVFQETASMSPPTTSSINLSASLNQSALQGAVQQQTNGHSKLMSSRMLQFLANKLDGDGPQGTAIEEPEDVVALTLPRFISLFSFFMHAMKSFFVYNIFTLFFICIVRCMFILFLLSELSLVVQMVESEFGMIPVHLWVKLHLVRQETM